MRGLDVRLGVFVGIVCALLALNNLLPYAGLRDDSCQTMFSGLEWGARKNNHAFMPQRALADRWTYLSGVRADVDPPPSDARTRRLARWLDRPERRLNVDAVRAVVWQLCGAGHRVRLSHDGRSYDACEHPRFARPALWIPVRLYETDLPEQR